MTEVSTVLNYMKGVPAAAEHAKTYATEFTEREARSAVKVVDGAVEEKKAIPHGEKEIIGRLNANAKFTRTGLVSDLKVGVGVSLGSGGRVRRECITNLDFLGTTDWFLDAAASRALYSKKESTVHLLDAEQRRRILSRCPNLSGQDASGISMLSVHERLSIPQDLRHMMMKMYLILCDYNLGVVSKKTQCSIAAGLSYSIQMNASPLDRLVAITNYDVVVDCDAFTPEELGLIGLAGEEYPSVWYGGENIYTKCHMQKDSVLFISDTSAEMDKSLAWGSPDRLYHMIWSIAAKMDAIPSWISAIEMMRGKCQMVANMLPHIEGNIINSMIPKSFSQVCAISSTP